MKFKRTVLLAAFVVTMGLLLGSGTAQADENVIFDPNDDEKAIGITGLDIDGTIYDVEFLESTTAFEVYGEQPGDFDFDTAESAAAAVDAVNTALSSKDALKVGQTGGSSDLSNRTYAVGYDSVGPTASVSRGLSLNPWTRIEDIPAEYCCGRLTYATFTLGANPVRIGGRVIHLEGSGLQLQNNGGDTLDISGNGSFVFSEPILTGDTYNVTVATQPESPEQTCSVTRGSGTASTENVTDVLVSCVPFTPLDVVRVFVTSEDFDGDLGGLAGGDAKCQAAAAGLGGEPWTAWLSTDTEDAIDRIPDGEYRLLDDTLVALNKQDLITQKANSGDYLRNAININENGEEDFGADVWTGTASDGALAAGSCDGTGGLGGGWTVNTEPTIGFAGTTSSTNGSWTGDISAFCNTRNRLYCFSVPAPDETSFAYVSQTPGCNGGTPCYTSIISAVDGEASGTVIKITGEDYDEAVTLGSDKNLVLSGGWDLVYLTQSSETTIDTLTVENGRVETKFIVIDGP